MSLHQAAIVQWALDSSILEPTSTSHLPHASDLLRLAVCALLHGVCLHVCGGLVSRNATRFCEARKVMQGSLDQSGDRNVSGLKGDVSNVSLLDSH